MTFQTFLLLSGLLPLFHCYEIATVAVDSVYTAVFATADSTTTETMSDTANIAGSAISDVSDDSDLSAASSIANAFSLLKNRYCNRGQSFHCCSRYV